MVESGLRNLAAPDEADDDVGTGFPAELIHTGIEIRQDLITDAAGQRQWADRLTRVFREIEPLLLKMVSAKGRTPARAHHQS